MSNCWFCNSKLIWQNDFMTEDFGGEENGLVTVLKCSDCNTNVYFVNYYDDEE